ncbi:LAFA_0G02058g1_1 [Lachancea sp. 'fantastica']|nr:LAFA_0G02058g1_1 [Lachancea sp. 'fantastica']
MLILQRLLIVSIALRKVLGSIGDRLDEFTECVEDCQVALSCPGFEDELPTGIASGPHPVFVPASSVASNLFFWDCTAHCDYQCQQIITQLRIHEGEPVVQFHGKWPFKRMLGMQELFSTIFSVANFVPHYRGYQMLQHELKVTPSHSKVRLVLSKYLYVAMAGMLAWTSSSIFHFRDLEITEKLDYFFAGATVLSAFHAILIRVGRLYRQELYHRVVSAMVLLIFSMHVLRQYLDWSYTYNMRFNVAFGVLQYVLLLTVAYRNYKQLKTARQTRKAHFKTRRSMIFDLCVVPAALVIGTSLSMSCELIDFFSYKWQIDSHAIWHACTIFPSWKLYDFFINDYRYLEACESGTED